MDSVDALSRSHCRERRLNNDEAYLFVGVSARSEVMLTPLRQFVRQFLVDSAENQYCDEIEHWSRDAGDHRRLRSRDAFHPSVQRNCNQNTIQDDRYDEYQHHTGLQTHIQTHTHVQ